MRIFFSKSSFLSNTMRESDWTSIQLFLLKPWLLTLNLNHFISKDKKSLSLLILYGWQSAQNTLAVQCITVSEMTQCAYWWNMHASFSVCSLRDDNVITSKPTWKLKHKNSILEYFEYFCQMSSKSILIIFSYTVSKSVRFFETQCISCNNIHSHL